MIFAPHVQVRVFPRNVVYDVGHGFTHVDCVRCAVSNHASAHAPHATRSGEILGRLVGDHDPIEVIDGALVALNNAGDAAKISCGHSLADEPHWNPGGS